MKKIVLACGVALSLASCAPSKVIAPLDEGQWQVGVTSGRPQINDGSLNLLGFYAAKGMQHEKTGYGGMQITSALLGTVQLEGGVLHGIRPSQGWSPGFSWNSAGHLAVSTRDGATRFYPEATGNAYWKLGPHILHATAGTWVDPLFFQARYGKGNPVAPHLGAGYRFRNKWFEAQIEYKLLNPITELVVPQATVPGVSGYGARGWYYGIAIQL